MFHQITWEKDGVFVECKGDLTIQYIHKVNGLLHGDERFEGHKYQVWDFLNSNLSQITLDEMKEPAAIDLVASAYAKKVRVAIIVQEPHSVKLMRYYCDLCNEDDSQWRARNFDNSADANKWVGL